MGRIAAGLAVVALLFASSGWAEIRGDRFFSPKWNISLRIPRHWLATDHNAYPSVLLWMVRHNPRAKLLFSAETVRSGMTSRDYANFSADRVKKMGFVVREPQVHGATGAYWVDFNDGTSYLRQAVLVHAGAGYVLTLAAPSVEARKVLARTFDSTLRSIRGDASIVSNPPADVENAQDGGLGPQADANSP